MKKKSGLNINNVGMTSNLHKATNYFTLFSLLCTTSFSCSYTRNFSSSEKLRAETKAP